MNKLILLISLVLTGYCLTGQVNITGILSHNGEPVSFANIILYQSDSTEIHKVETSDEYGKFTFTKVPNGEYVIECSYVGLDSWRESLSVTGSSINLGGIVLIESSIQLDAATVTAKRRLVEVHSDKTVFNVQGTVNSTGSDGLNLLRKAPGLILDNNNGISILGRSGVIVYIDGKLLPLTGDDLTSYLQSLTSEQIDRIDIITNPGSKYDAEGNAGIIDIRLKRDKNHGLNGSVSSSYSIGLEERYNTNLNLNYRGKKASVFGTLGGFHGDFRNDISFANELNGFNIVEDNVMINTRENINARLGTDFFVGENHTIGFLVSRRVKDGGQHSVNNSLISQNLLSASVDSVLLARNDSDDNGLDQTYNVNYVFKNKNSQLNFDLDYGSYDNSSSIDQPNTYYSDASLQNILSVANFETDTDTDIDIYTAKVDYETEIKSGRLSVGSKYGSVRSDNSFVFSEENEIGNFIIDPNRSNDFAYDENVLAGYFSYSNSLTPQLKYSLGLRAENTNSKGVLSAEFQSATIDTQYLQFFPNLGLTYSKTPEHVFSFSAGRRINRPDYNVLNPFRTQLSELSFSRGNPSLRPEVVANIELGYTLKYRFNFKISYSHTNDQITRFIGPDESNPQASFINWDNLATQDIVNFNASLPFTITKWWSLYANASVTYQRNKSQEDDILIEAVTPNLYHQSSFKLPWSLTGELSGWFNGRGIWGGVFEYDPSYSLDVGLQRKFFKDKLNLRVSVSDIFKQAGWSGVSHYQGLTGTGQGEWDSRRFSISANYSFGNQNVKTRKRETGLESESKRVEGGGAQDR